MGTATPTAPRAPAPAVQPQAAGYTGNAAGLLGPGATSQQVYGVDWQSLLSPSYYANPWQSQMQFYQPPSIMPITQQLPMAAAAPGATQFSGSRQPFTQASLRQALERNGPIDWSSVY